jgi:hypothetical protein
MELNQLQQIFFLEDCSTLESYYDKFLSLLNSIFQASSYADKINNIKYPILNVNQVFLLNYLITFALTYPNDQTFRSLLNDQSNLNRYYKLSHLQTEKGANINLLYALEMIYDADEASSSLIFLIHCEQLHVMMNQVTKQESSTLVEKKTSPTKLSFQPMKRRQPQQRKQK